MKILSIIGAAVTISGLTWALVRLANASQLGPWTHASTIEKASTVGWAYIPIIVGIGLYEWGKHMKR